MPDASSPQETPEQRDERLWLERYQRQQRLIHPERYASSSKYVGHQGTKERARRLKQAEKAER